MGADPTLLTPGGGGELARDCEVEVIDTLSDMETCSLDGVPGRFIDATLGLRDGSLPTNAVDGVETDGTTGGASALGVAVCTTRNVLGAVLKAGEGILAFGLAGTDGADGAWDTVRSCLMGVPTSAGVDAAFELVV
jgi:hypothetical protein